MCMQETRTGALQMPDDAGQLRTGIEKCQKTGIFLNSTDGNALVVTAGASFVLPAGGALTVPVGPEIAVRGEGEGVIVWEVTSAVLSPAVTAGPQIQMASTHAPESAGGAVTPINAVNGDVDIHLSSGDYHKLVFLGVM